MVEPAKISPGINRQIFSAAILAGGLGTRLREAVSDRPKVLAVVHDRPFLEYLFDQLRAAGFRSVTLCVGYMAEKIEQLFGSQYRELELVYSREDSPLGTGGALRLALPHLSGSTVLVMNGDSFCDLDISAFCSWHLSKQSSVSIALTEVDDTSRYGSVRRDAHEHIQSFEEKGTSQGRGLVNAGIYLLSRSVLEEIPPGRALSLERDFFPKRISRGLCGYTAKHQRFIDIGTPTSYSQAQTLF